ncbi:PucR family transcriptional regulator [Paenibacillus thermotolerans]|uniref:PucR family transcriptional regulator n=1 Tax=Paenibacillus thermotolerans TaxID=3027807 RepID=UPI002367916D|nr:MULTISPECIES: helix-turn-helix domain-containing protein [unclassified Paenibacillus]
MEWETLRARLEHILNRRIALVKGLPEHTDREHTVIETAEGRYIVIEGSLAATEEKLIALLLESQRSKARVNSTFSEEERQSLLLSSWMMERLEEGDVDAALPESFTAWPSLSGMKIPILLYGEFSEKQQFSYGELGKLLQSFFDAEVTIIPLHNKQWFILGDVSLLGEGRGEDGFESALSEFASGLQEMIASEWMGECHVAVTYPFQPTKDLISTVVLLQELIDLGRAYRFSTNIHMPWELRLESLLDKAPAGAKRRFVDSVFKRSETSLDAELVVTLEAFFLENCNVSDTAKRLYIHRNTLLYRLDKFKQETGLDVKLFDDAVLVKLALMLYKVTKRK